MFRRSLAVRLCHRLEYFCRFKRKSRKRQYVCSCVRACLDSNWIDFHET